MTNINFRNPKQVKSFFNEKGRECTACGEFKEWNQFSKTKKTITGRVSICRSCKRAKRRSTRNYPLERYSAKKRRQLIREIDPLLAKARQTRQSLLRRTNELNPKDSIPSSKEIESWLKSLELKCYYSGEVLSANKLVIDHKTPLSRGGLSQIDNLCICSHHMNTAKGTMNENEFKQILNLIRRWEDKGKELLKRLKQGYFRR